MKPRVYLETSVISYLTGRPNRDLVTAAHQQITREWWDHRDRFELFVSQAVLTEISRGEPEVADRRMDAIRGVVVLPVTNSASQLAERFLEEHAMPAKAAIDAIHVAVAVVNGMDYLLIWNCAHIANAVRRLQIERTTRSAGYQSPVICTPEELTLE